MARAVSGIHHVQVAAPAACEDEARRFFGTLLGLEELRRPPGLAARGGCWFATGAQELHVGVEEPFAPAAKAHPALEVATPEALEELAARLEAAGVEVRRPASGELPGWRRLHVSDPWGNRLELLAREPGA